MVMYNLLIIDDQNESENRKLIYEFMFGGNFRITCIDSEEENIASALKNEYFDCVILDNTLNKGLEKEAVITLVSEYKYPIIMVSNVRSFTEKEYEKEGIIDFISLNQYFSLREFERATENKGGLQNELIHQSLKDLHERVTYDIFSVRKYKSEDINQLTICHISDIQFCDPHVDENATRTLFTKLEEFIINRDTPIDVLVVSGDIVFSGKKREFFRVKEALQNFQSKLKRQRKNVYIILVPGNHDFDYQCYLSQESNKCNLDTNEFSNFFDKIKEKYVGKNIEKENLIDEIYGNKVTPSIFRDFEADSSFLNNFREFAYDITGDAQYLKKDFYITSERYLKRGFSLIGINNAYKYHKNLNNTKRYIYELNSDVVEHIKQPIYTIGIGHIDPRNLGYQTVCETQDDRCNSNLFRTECSANKQYEKWGDMQRFFKRTNSVIYLCGHKHCSDIELSQDKSILFIGAASPTGANPSEKTVNVIEINKKGKKLDINIAVHRATSENISFIQKYIYHYNGLEWENTIQK